MRRHGATAARWEQEGRHQPGETSRRARDGDCRASGGGSQCPFVRCPPWRKRPRPGPKGARMFEQQPPSYQQQGAYQQGYDPDYQRMVSSVKGPSKAPWVLMLLVLVGAGAGGYWLYHDREAA